MRPDTILSFLILFLIVSYSGLHILALLFPDHKKKGHFVPFENVVYAIGVIATLYGVYHMGIDKGGQGLVS